VTSHNFKWGNTCAFVLKNFGILWMSSSMTVDKFIRNQKRYKTISRLFQSLLHLSPVSKWRRQLIQVTAVSLTSSAYQNDSILEFNHYWAINSQRHTWASFPASVIFFKVIEEQQLNRSQCSIGFVESFWNDKKIFFLIYFTLFVC